MDPEGLLDTFHSRSRARAKNKKRWWIFVVRVPCEVGARAEFHESLIPWITFRKDPLRSDRLTLCVRNEATGTPTLILATIYPNRVSTTKDPYLRFQIGSKTRDVAPFIRYVLEAAFNRPGIYPDRHTVTLTNISQRPMTLASASFNMDVLADPYIIKGLSPRVTKKAKSLMQYRVFSLAGYGEEFDGGGSINLMPDGASLLGVKSDTLSLAVIYAFTQILLSTPRTIILHCTEIDGKKVYKQGGSQGPCPVVFGDEPVWDEDGNLIEELTVDMVFVAETVPFDEPPYGSEILESMLQGKTLKKNNADDQCRFLAAPRKRTRGPRKKKIEN